MKYQITKKAERVWRSKSRKSTVREETSGRGRTALRIETDCELLPTQKFALQPLIEANMYGKRDAEHSPGSRLSVKVREQPIGRVAEDSSSASPIA